MIADLVKQPSFRNDRGGFKRARCTSAVGEDRTISMASESAPQTALKQLDMTANTAQSRFRPPHPTLRRCCIAEFKIIRLPLSSFRTPLSRQRRHRRGRRRRTYSCIPSQPRDRISPIRRPRCCRRAALTPTPKLASRISRALEEWHLSALLPPP
ncbi:hypothetical protein VTK56DRAFT_3779 [Thermocarpiscus australiensis]